MAAQLRSKYDIIINGGGIVGSTLLNLTLKSPHLNRTKVLLIEQASKLTSFRQPPRIVEKSPSNQTVGTLSGDVRSSNRVFSITQASKLAFKRMGVWDLVRPYANDVTKINVRNLSTSHSSDSQDSNKGKIKKLLTDSKKRVFVFMKGVPSEPACGYSNAVVQILNAYGVEYDSFDVLSDEGVRQEVKAYSNWPTIPQVYVDGSFIGGCDILIQMHQTNELESLFKTDEKGNNNDGDKKEK